PRTLVLLPSFPTRRSSDLGAEHLVQDESPLAFELDEPSPLGAAVASNGQIAALEQKVRQLEQQVSSMRSQHRASLDEILRALSEDRKSTRLNSSHDQISYA